MLLTDGPTFLMTLASYSVKFRKSVRYAIRSSREVLMSTGSTSCVKMTGHFACPAVLCEEGDVEPELCDEWEPVTVSNEYTEASSVVGTGEAVARKGQIFSTGVLPSAE